MMTLDELCIKHSTDKATLHSVKGHGYAPIYDRLFSPLRHEPIKFLEIGVGGGESIRVWLEYFDKAQIFGIDMVRDTNILNMGGKPFERYTFSHGNQTDRTMWACFRANHGVHWDVVIDDGGHYADQVIVSFEEMWPHIKPGGYWIIEDLGVASSPGTVFVPEGWPNHLDWLRDKMKEMNKGSDIESLTFYPELAIFRKHV